MGGPTNRETSKLIDNNGYVANFDQNGNQYVSIGDGASIDAAGRLRTNPSTTLFENKFLTDNQPLYWDDQQTAGAGTSSTYNANQSSVTLAVSNVTAGTRVRETFRMFNYQSGKSELVLLTGRLGAGATGITKRIGAFDGQNGLFFELSGTTLNVVRRTFTSGVAVDNAVAQASWNIDKFDGLGPSGITLDITDIQTFVIDFQWLGSGRIRFGFQINGRISYCHEILWANTQTLVWASVPNFPLRFEISNSGAGPAASLNQMNSTVLSEGNVDETGLIFALDRGSNSFVTNNNANVYSLLAMRLKATHLASNVYVTRLTCLNTSTANYRVSLILNPTVAGPGFSFTAVTNSSVETDITRPAATTLTAGTVLASFYSGTAREQNHIIPYSIPLGANIAGTRDIIVLAIQRLTGTTETFFGGITIRDIQ